MPRLQWWRDANGWPERGAMRFLTRAECLAWCSAQGQPDTLNEALENVAGTHAVHYFRIPEDAHARVVLCRELWARCGSHGASTSLLWVTEWSVWPSGEHMPLFTRWRQALGEHRPLLEVPGHLVTWPADNDDGLSVLVVSMGFLWDCRIHSDNGTSFFISHDEYGYVLEPLANPSDIPGLLDDLGVSGDP